MIVVSPRSFAAITAARPTGPAPVIRIDSPAWQFKLFITAPAPVWRPQPSGPTISCGIDGSTFTTLRSAARA